jgi:N-acetylmuramoyl-L-alanine amidase
MPGNPDRVRDLLQLKEIWESLGLRVLAMKGWRDRGRISGNTFEVLGVHHTGGDRDNDRLLRDGRIADGVPGPLCNVALHANGDVVLVASGLANHFGKATWPNGRSLGVEATGPQDRGQKFPNYDAYVRLAAGFCIFKGNVDPRGVVRGDVGIPVHLVAAHKEVAVFKDNPKVYGRKPDPDFEQDGRVVKGALAHGFSVSAKAPSVRLIDTFRDQVRALVEEDISIADKKTQEFLEKQFASIRGRIDRAVQRIGGRSNSIYNDNNDDFKGLVMAKEALAEAKGARDAADRVAGELAKIRAHLGIPIAPPESPASGGIP